MGSSPDAPARVVHCKGHAFCIPWQDSASMLKSYPPHRFERESDLGYGGSCCVKEWKDKGLQYM
ncbi:hypothetical protein GF325_06745 [Candidatus Bathyarchaeota archaeon]|nr:hypothetical protein [Candidatus Bathyarchaeota archaeon]